MTINRLATLPIHGPARDNREAPRLPAIVLDDGRLRCPGEHCRGIINRHTPPRCPDCLQPLLTGKPPVDPRVLEFECGGGGCVLQSDPRTLDPARASSE